jgi:hypothetical protein
LGPVATSSHLQPPATTAKPPSTATGRLTLATSGNFFGGLQKKKNHVFILFYFIYVFFFFFIFIILCFCFPTSMFRHIEFEGGC